MRLLPTVVLLVACSDPKVQQTQIRPLKAEPKPKIQLHTDVRPLELHVSLENHGTTSVSLHHSFTLEKRVGPDTWQNTTGVGQLQWRTNCSTAQPDCHTIIPGAALEAPPIDTEGSAQCQCKTCKAIAPGTYRWRWQTCSKKHSGTSGSFPIEDWDSLVEEDLKHDIR